MSATAIFVIALIGGGILVAAGIFAVAWRRGPSAAPMVGEFDKEAAKRDVSARPILEPEATATEEAPAEAMPAEPVPASIEDQREAVTADDLGVTRRMFLNRAALGLFGFGFLGSLGIAMLAFMWPKLKGGFGSKINAGPLAALRSQVVPGDGSIKPLFFPEAQAWLVPMEQSLLPGSSFEGLPVVAGADGGETGLMALWQKCVHLGCRVPECASSQGFECPCHGSKYNFHGEYDSGPAPRNLDRFALEEDSQGNLIIDTGSVVETPRAVVKTIAYPQGPSCL
ncbi:MAG: Rieske 2Fe-2S domain-containing protein [Acidimicrobiia bacterium]|nr:Rieske 2Fe-2S domain-containing protein [Acidimicrobiia bacterium]